MLVFDNHLKYCDNLEIKAAKQKFSECNIRNVKESIRKNYSSDVYTSEWQGCKRIELFSSLKALFSSNFMRQNSFEFLVWFVRNVVALESNSKFPFFQPVMT